MLGALTQLVCFQVLGEVVSRALGLPVPGPVLGLVLLLAWFGVRGGPDAPMQETSTGLLRSLGLLFVPAGVGVVTQLDALAADWLPITVAVVVSTGLGLAVTALIMQHLDRR